jgi:PKD repeat protein
MIPLVGSVLGSGKGCQFDGNSNVQEPNGNQQADVSLKYISHEQAESITDPLPPEGWIDNEAPGSGGEVGDQCNATGFFDPLVMGTNPAAFLPILGGSAVSGNLFDQVDNGDQYYVQSEWSNGDVNCEMTPPAAAISATFAAAASGGSTISLNPAGTLSVAGFSSATWDFGDGTTNFQPSAPAAVSHTYAAAGTYRVALTVVDIHGNAAISTQQMTVGLPPTGSFKSSPAKPGQGAAVSFRGTASDADTGVTTTVTWRFGDGSTGSGLTTSHVYKKRGKHKVTMTITDSAGHTTSISRTVTVATSTITKVKVMHRTNSGATLVITVNAPGKVLAGGKTKRASRPGTVKLQLSLSGSQPTIELKFIPKIGRTVTRKVTV